MGGCRAAQCEEFLGRLEHGWDTPAGEAGKQLSGGERQRIAIARAILKDAPIVILDEATAFTDPENEDKIQRSLMALSQGKTLLVIAHRLSTIQNADQIVVLEKGRIVDKGTQPGTAQPMPALSKAVAGPCGCPELGGWKGGLTMFRSMNRILRWTKGYHRRLYLGSLCSFLATWAAAGPVMLAAWALGLVIESAQEGTALDPKLPWLWPGWDRPADHSAFRVRLLEKPAPREHWNRAGSAAATGTG